MSKRKTTAKSTNERKGVLPKMELLIIFVFFMSFIVWAMSKCNSTQAAYTENEEEVTPKEVEETTAEIPAKPLAETPSTENKPTTLAPPEKVTVLYVVLEGLKLRKGPHLDSSIVRTLSTNSEVYFLNDVTNFKQEINLGDRIAVEPWIKVRAYSGHEGWVYGAGVHYFKPRVVTDTVQ